MEMLRARGYPLKSIWVGETSKESLFPGGWRFTHASALQSIRLDVNVDVYHIDLNLNAQVGLTHL